MNVEYLQRRAAASFICVGIEQEQQLATYYNSGYILH